VNARLLAALDATDEIIRERQAACAQQIDYTPHVSALSDIREAILAGDTRHDLVARTVAVLHRLERVLRDWRHVRDADRVRAIREILGDQGGSDA
jgi:hypothetical protein